MPWSLLLLFCFVVGGGGVSIGEKRRPEVLVLVGEQFTGNHGMSLIHLIYRKKVRNSETLAF